MQIIKFNNVDELLGITGIGRILGGILGLILGLAWAEIAAIVIFAVLEIFANILPSFPEEAFAGLKVTRWFFEHNIFRAIFAS